MNANSTGSQPSTASAPAKPKTPAVSEEHPPGSAEQREVIELLHQIVELLTEIDGSLTNIGGQVDGIHFRMP